MLVGTVRITLLSGNVDGDVSWIAGGEFGGSSKWTGWVIRQDDEVKAIATASSDLRATQVPCERPFGSGADRGPRTSLWRPIHDIRVARCPVILFDGLPAAGPTHGAARRRRISLALQVAEDGPRIDAEIARRLRAVAVVSLEHLEDV